jgi:hypothetical protein
VVVAAFGAVREAVADIGRGMDAVVMAVLECTGWDEVVEVTEG